MSATTQPGAADGASGDRIHATRLAPPEESLKTDRGADLSLLSRLIPYARPQARLFTAALITMPLASGAALSRPLLIKGAIDAALVERSQAALTTVVWLFVLAVSVEFVARFAQIYLVQLGGQRVLAQLRRDTFAKIQRLHLSYFDRTPVGKVVTRVTNDADSLGELFASGAVMAVADILMLGGVVGFMLYLDWRLSLVAFCALPPLALVVAFFRRFAREAFRSIRAKIATLNAYMAEQVQGVAVVQAFGRERECQAEYEAINADYRDANHRSIRYDALLYSVVESVSSVTVALVLWYAAVRVGMIDEGSSVLWVGTVVAFYEYIQSFFVPIRDLSQKYTILQSSLAAAERIFGILDMDELDAPKRERGEDVSSEPLASEPACDAAPASDADPVLALDGVRFGYRPDTEVLHGVHLAARRGEKIAIVGATGAGKTTVTALLLRLYDVLEGRVLVHGKDVRDWDARALRRVFGVVSQDVFLFAGTVLENVAVGEDGPPDRERARVALQRVGAWELLARRGVGPSGDSGSAAPNHDASPPGVGVGEDDAPAAADHVLDAIVDERGANFSAGERQLLAFARALYLGREVLILDEATASIDSETESKLQRAIEEVLVDRTAIIIAHRLSTIRKADRIVVFHAGQIVEQGTHDELLDRDGVYSQLHRLQFALS